MIDWVQNFNEWNEDFPEKIKSEIMNGKRFSIEIEDFNEYCINLVDILSI